MVDFLRSVFSSSLKTNDALEKGIMTGCLRISKESIFTGLNNLKVYSILDYENDDCFGFSETEVRQLLDDYHISEYFDEVKEEKGNHQYELIIPNREVYKIYQQSFMDYFDNYTTNRKKELYQLLVAGDEERANELLDDILERSISYYDNYENFYHGFLVGLFSYEKVESNREAGKGRFDLAILPRRITETALIIECKHSMSDDDLLADSESGAK